MHMSIVFGMEKLNHYTSSSHIKVQTDHKVLETKKSLMNTPKQLQTMVLRQQKYDIYVTYIPGSDMLLADPLSLLTGCT